MRVYGSVSMAESCFVSAEARTVVLRFSDWLDLEPQFDTASVEISIDEGAQWTPTAFVVRAAGPLME